jgi:hypothetical protein
MLFFQCALRAPREKVFKKLFENESDAQAERGLQPARLARRARVAPCRGEHLRVHGKYMRILSPCRVQPRSYKVMASAAVFKQLLRENLVCAS